MTQHAPTTDNRFVVNFSHEAVLEAIGRIRAVNDEMDPEHVEPPDEYRRVDRRKSRRVQLQMPVILTPVEEIDETTVEVCGTDQLAVTRDISAQGLGILHDTPLMEDFAIVQFDIPGETPSSLLYEIRWSVRKTRYSFMSGGRLTGVATPT